MHIILTAVDDPLVEAWGRFCGDLPGVTIHCGSVFDVHCDALVSPANSFGFMDGGIDALYTQRFGRQVQQRLQELIRTRHHGELLVGMADIVHTDDAAFPFVIAAPTMRVPMILRESVNPYLEHVDGYYRHPDGTPTGEEYSVRHALDVLRKMFGRTRVEDFRPLRLKAVRDEMIAKGWCRKTVNEQISRIKRMYKWGVENELVPADRYHALQAVSGLKLGRTSAPESEPVKPVPEALVEAVLPLVSAQVAAMIRLQLLTGMRPGEVLIMRTGDIDRSGDIWVYRPIQHKTAHHHHIRQVFLGPKAQEVITPFLKPDQAEVYIFSAAEADQELRRQRHEARVTPLEQGNSPGTNRKRRPKCHPGAKYRRDSYTRAISRACEQAFPVPDGLSAEEVEKWRREHHWHPHQLRHNAATRVRKLFGIDAAGTILGHKTLAVTAIYAEKDMEEAIAIMKQIG